MRQLIGPSLAVSAALALAACGGNANSGAAVGSSPRSPSATVTVKNIPDVGQALVTAGGMTLYTPNLERSGSIRCTGACTSFWKPLTPAGAGPTAHGDAGKLGVIKRPDGSRQVTSNGRPLYTFVEDKPGDAKGDGFTDAFSGRHFVWHAIAAGGRPSGPPSTGSGGAGYSGGGY